MIFVILGTQKFQFNRLLKMLDTLVEKKVISEPICAQIGYSTYQPKYYEYHQFYSEEDFQKKIAESDYIIAHGGLIISISWQLFSRAEDICSWQKAKENW